MNVSILSLLLILPISRSFLSVSKKAHTASTFHWGKKAQSSTQQQFESIIRSIKITPTMTYAITMLLPTEMLVQNQLDRTLVGYVEFRMLLVSISFTPC